MLTRERVLELFDVDLETGAVLWKRPTSNRVKVGAHAASMVGIEGRRYSLEHLRHLVRTGEMPKAGPVGADHETGWRVVPGLSEAYEVSEWGEVRSRARWVDQKSGAMRFFPAVTLSPKLQKNGYLAVVMRDASSGQNREATVHSLVAEAFLPPRPEGYEVRHRDGSQRNNRATNLEWGTHQQNQRDQYRHGTRIASHWHPRARLTLEQVLLAKESTKSTPALANELGVPDGVIYRLRKGLTYQALTRRDLASLVAG